MKLICDHKILFINKVTSQKEDISESERQIEILRTKTDKAVPVSEGPNVRVKGGRYFNILVQHDGSTRWSQQVPNNRDTSSQRVDYDSNAIEHNSSEITENSNYLRSMMELSVENLQQDSAEIQPSSNRSGQGT